MDYANKIRHPNNTLSINRNRCWVRQMRLKNQLTLHCHTHFTHTLRGVVSFMENSIASLLSTLYSWCERWTLLAYDFIWEILWFHLCIIRLTQMYNRSSYGSIQSQTILYYYYIYESDDIFPSVFLSSECNSEGNIRERV